jgi:hypothetical protein
VNCLLLTREIYLYSTCDIRRHLLTGIGTQGNLTESLRFMRPPNFEHLSTLRTMTILGLPYGDNCCLFRSSVMVPYSKRDPVNAINGSQSTHIHIAAHLPGSCAFRPTRNSRQPSEMAWERGASVRPSFRPFLLNSGSSDFQK